MSEDIDVHRLALGVIKASVEQMRAAYDRLVCPGRFGSGEDDAVCQACGLVLAHHYSAWVEQFLEAPPEEWDALVAARWIRETLAEHADCKRFFVAGSGSTFPLYCRLLNQDPERRREQLRPVMFFPWSPIALRRALEHAPTKFERLKKRRYRETLRAA